MVNLSYTFVYNLCCIALNNTVPKGLTIKEIHKMKSLLEWITQRVRKSSMSEDEKYLASSTSLEELERRQKLLSYGKAPHQTGYQYPNGVVINGRMV